MRNIAKPTLVLAGNLTPVGPSVTKTGTQDARPAGDSASSDSDEPTLEQTPPPTVRSATGRAWPPTAPGAAGRTLPLLGGQTPPLPTIVPRSGQDGRLPLHRKIIAVVKGASAPGQGLIRAVLDDKQSQFVVRAIAHSLDSDEGRFLRTLGVEVVAGDVGDEASLKKAFAGAYAAFYILLSSEHPFLDTKLAEANSLARAAKGAGLQHVIWATLEDPGQTLLKHDDLTPTFKDGRWVPDSDGKNETESVFAKLEVPTTYLQTSWDPAVAAGKWAEDIGKYAYGILRSRDSISKTVSISAASLAAGLVKVPGDVPATVGKDAQKDVTEAAAQVSAPAPKQVSAPAPKSIPVPSAPPGFETPVVGTPRRSKRPIAIAAVVMGLVAAGLILAGRSRNQKSDPVPAAPAATAVAPATEATRAPAPAPSGEAAKETAPVAATQEAQPDNQSGLQPESPSELPSGSPSGSSPPSVGTIV